LYAPFVKSTDKIKKDTADISLSDFQPKRFALQYAPPTIILEYLVPSTGKLYHHKMKLRHLTHDMKMDDVMEYLQKRHPLYFINNKFRENQIEDLVKRLQFRLKNDAKAKENASNTTTTALG
jgi:centrosomal protein CEP19